jgi:hypothetical protein
MSQNLPKFLIVRFAPGAAGNMISSLLQCSPEVAHWSEEQQNKKPCHDWMEYFTQVFPKDINKWLYHEPIGKLQWGTRNIFSAKYERGNSLTVEKFLELEEKLCTPYYHQQKLEQKYLPIFWHKKFMPAYFANSRSIIIHLDRKSVRWFDHAVYHKHHQIVESTKDYINVRLLENRPEIIVKGFQQQVEYEKRWPNFRQFVKERIIDNPWRLQYQHTYNIPAWSIPTSKVNLSDLLDNDTISSCYQSICEFLEISAILEQQVKSLHSYWKGLHAF